MQKNALRRVYEKMTNGMVKQADCVHCSKTNNLIAAPAASVVPVRAEAAQAAGGLIVSSSQLQNAMNYPNKREQAPASIAAAIQQPTAPYETHGAVTAQGALTTVDLKSSKGGNTGLDSQQISVVLRNTNAAGGAAITGVVGDANEIIRDDSEFGGLGIGAQPAALEVGGQWGVNTLERIRKMSGNSTLQFHGMHVISNKLDGSEDTAFFSQGKIRTAKASYVGDAPKVVSTKTQHQVGQGAFNKNIRVLNGFETLLTDMDALLVTVPAGVEVTVTLGLVAVGSGSVMEKPF